MPTLSYIAEAAIDRYYERGGEDAVKPAPTFVCELCDAEFSTTLDLSRHFPQAHPLAPPRLLINERQVVGAETIRRPLAPDSLRVLAATEIELHDGQGIQVLDESELGALLANRRRGRAILVLRSRLTKAGPTAEESVTLDFDIPDPGALHQADRAFEAAFNSQDVSLEQLEEFDAANSRLESGRAYGAALYDYCAAVAIVDGAIPPPRGKRLVVARERFQSALAVLRDFEDRPIARAACGFIRFSLNDLHHWRVAGAPELDDCAGELSRAIDPDWKSPRSSGGQGGGKRIPVCRAPAHLIEGWTHSAEPKFFAAYAERPELAYEDKAKARALCLLACKDHAAMTDSVVDSARSLVYDGVFGRWAQGWREMRGLGE